MGDLESRVHEMAASYVKFRTKEFLTQFLIDSGAAHDLYKSYVEHVVGVRIQTLDEYTEHLVQDYAPVFGRIIGISYALGYADHLQGKTYQELYVPKHLADDADAKGTQLILPGILDK